MVSQQQNAEWWDERPMSYFDWELPYEHRVADNNEFFTILNEKYVGTNPYIKKFFSSTKWLGERVLEVGIGFGSGCLLLAEKSNGVYGIDLSRTALEYSKKNIEFGEKKNVTILQMDAETMSFKDGSFDFIYSWGVIHHSNDMEKCLREIFRVMKRGGAGLIMVYNRNSLRYYLKGIYYLLLKGNWRNHSLASVQTLFTDGYYQKHVTISEMRDMLTRLRFSTLEFELSHMSKKYVPFIPRPFDEWIKTKLGWLLIVRFKKA